MNNEELSYSYSAYCDEFNVSLSTGKRDLKDLFEKDLIYKKKIRNTVFYFLK